MIRITSQVEGRRRAGVVHSKRPSNYPDEYFSAAQLLQLEADPMLLVQHLQDDAGSDVLDASRLRPILLSPAAAVSQLRALQLQLGPIRDGLEADDRVEWDRIEDAWRQLDALAPDATIVTFEAARSTQAVNVIQSLGYTWDEDRWLPPVPRTELHVAPAADAAGTDADAAIDVPPATAASSNADAGADAGASADTAKDAAQKTDASSSAPQPAAKKSAGTQRKAP